MTWCLIVRNTIEVNQGITVSTDERLARKALLVTPEIRIVGSQTMDELCVGRLKEKFDFLNGQLTPLDTVDISLVKSEARDGLEKKGIAMNQIPDTPLCNDHNRRAWVIEAYTAESTAAPDTNTFAVFTLSPLFVQCLVDYSLRLPAQIEESTNSAMPMRKLIMTFSWDVRDGMFEDRGEDSCLWELKADGNEVALSLKNLYGDGTTPVHVSDLVARFKTQAHDRVVVFSGEGCAERLNESLLRVNKSTEWKTPEYVRILRAALAESDRQLNEHNQNANHEPEPAPK